MQFKTVKELSDLLIGGDATSVEVTRQYLDRINTHNPALNAVITVVEDQALQQAEAADRQRKNNPDDNSPLLGIPMLHKDIFCTDGVRTSCASRMLDNFIAPYDATVVDKLKQAGTVMLGKTNMDEFAMGSSNENSHYGSVANPWDTERVPGGSSGGSAAAVAARLAPFATGTDTGGSIRQPAAFCGITGIKPTYGRVSRYGMIAFASSLDQGGPMATTAEDCAMVLEAMSGFDRRDSTSIDQPVDTFSSNLNESVKGMRIGIPTEYFSRDLDSAMADAVMAALDVFKDAGAELVEVSLPNQQLCVPAYYVIAPAECSSNLSRYDGVRFGHRCDDPVDLEDMYKRSRAEGFGAEVKRRIMVGTYALSAGYYDAYYLKAQQVRALIAQDFKTAFDNVDIIAGPVTPTTAFKKGEKTDDPVEMYLNDLYTISANLAGIPAMSIPCGQLDGLPVGLQLAGNYFQESRLLSAAHYFQQQTDWHTQCPNGFATEQA